MSTKAATTQTYAFVCTRVDCCNATSAILNLRTFRWDSKVSPYIYLYARLAVLSVHWCLANTYWVEDSYAWAVLLHPTIESTVFECHHYMVVNLFALQPYSIVWLPSTFAYFHNAIINYGKFALAGLHSRTGCNAFSKWLMMILFDHGFM